MKLSYYCVKQRAQIQVLRDQNTELAHEITEMRNYLWKTSIDSSQNMEVLFSEIQNNIAQIYKFRSKIKSSQAECCRLDTEVATAESRCASFREAQQNAEEALRNERALHSDLKAELGIIVMTADNKKLCKKRNALRAALKKTKKNCEGGSEVWL